jgi:DNA-binding MarR family transcriptional regulator
MTDRVTDRKTHVEELLDNTQILRRRISAFSGIAEAGITASQWLVVAHIFKNEGCTTNQAAAALNMSGSAVTQLVNGLVAKGFVVRERDQEDRRAYQLTLSNESKKRIDIFQKKRVRLMLKMFEALTDKEFEAYLALNKKIIKGLKK